MSRSPVKLLLLRFKMRRLDTKEKVVGMVEVRVLFSSCRDLAVIGGAKQQQHKKQATEVGCESKQRRNL